MKPVLDKMYKGINHVGQKPGHKEGKQNTRKGIQHPYRTCSNAQDGDSTNKTVKSYFLFKHYIFLVYRLRLRRFTCLRSFYMSRRTEIAARVKESLLLFGRVAFEEDDSQIAEIAEILNKNLENPF
jgi:hypothetical protein